MTEYMYAKRNNGDLCEEHRAPLDEVPPGRILLCYHPGEPKPGADNAKEMNEYLNFLWRKDEFDVKVRPIDD